MTPIFPEFPNGGNSSFDGKRLAGINDNGDVVGTAFSSSSLQTPPFLYGNVAGTVKAIERPEWALHYYMELTDITDDGLFLGNITNDGVNYENFLWRLGSEPTFFEIPGIPTAKARGANSLGKVVGMTTGNSIESDGFLYDPASGIVSAIMYPGGQDTYVDDINNSGTIVGAAGRAPALDFGFARHPNGTFEQIVFPGAVETIVLGLNDRGDVVGAYRAPGQSYSQAFVGWYVPEPSAVSLALVGLAAAFVFALSRRS